MKYAVLFTLAGLLAAILGVAYSGWYLLLLWPAASLVTVGVAYYRNDPSLFGKNQDGSMSRDSTVLLLPYLLYLWAVWHTIRILSCEDSVNQISDNLTIGRRLLPTELPSHVDVVADLTCEFSEPANILSSREYVAFPILDGVAPTAGSLAIFAKELAKIDRHLYIHCAQGHGRTGLVVAAVICARGLTNNAAEAIALIQAKRPGVRLGAKQKACLAKAIDIIASG